MKTYHEMTESVLERAKAEVLEQKRRRRNTIVATASGLCFALVLTVLGVGLKQTPAVVPTLPADQPGLSADATDAPQPTQQAKVKITYLSNIEGQTTQETVSPNVSVPLNGMIRIRDTRGLSEEEFDKAVLEETAIAEAFRLAGESSYIRWAYPGAIASIVSNGSITLDFSDCPVTNVDIETTGVGKVNRSSLLYGPNPEETTGTYWPNVREAHLDWTISSEFAYALHKDPTIPLESIRDTVTVTIDYANGTTETLIFDISVNEEGQIFVTQRGIPTVVA